MNSLLNRPLGLDCTESIESSNCLKNLCQMIIKTLSCDHESLCYHGMIT